MLWLFFTCKLHMDFLSTEGENKIYFLSIFAIFFNVKKYFAKYFFKEGKHFVSNLFYYRHPNLIFQSSFWYLLVVFFFLEKIRRLDLLHFPTVILKITKKYKNIWHKVLFYWNSYFYVYFICFALLNSSSPKLISFVYQWITLKNCNIYCCSKFIFYFCIFLFCFWKIFFPCLIV